MPALIPIRDCELNRSCAIAPFTTYPGMLTTGFSRGSDVVASATGGAAAAVPSASVNEAFLEAALAEADLGEKLIFSDTAFTSFPSDRGTADTFGALPG